jgi:hypothetical protein
MSVSLVSPWLGDSRTFLLTTCNIRCGWNTGLISAAKGLAHMGVKCVVLTEMKIMKDNYPRCTSGSKVILLKAMSHSQGGVALLWNKGHASFEVRRQILSPQTS